MWVSRPLFLGSLKNIYRTSESSTYPSQMNLKLQTLFGILLIKIETITQRKTPYKKKLFANL